MRILVTGATGFVGFAVAAHLLDQGHSVVGLTRSGTAALPLGVTRVRGDLTDGSDLPAVVADVDGVCHLAALTQARESLRDPVRYWRTNVGGTLTCPLRRSRKNSAPTAALSPIPSDGALGDPIWTTSSGTPGLS